MGIKESAHNHRRIIMASMLALATAMGIGRFAFTPLLPMMLHDKVIFQATGVAMSQILPSLLGFALGSLLVGLPFTAITYFAMQEARRIRPQLSPPPWVC